MFRATICGNTAAGRGGRSRFRGTTRCGSRWALKTQTAGFDLKLDPRVKVSQADLEQQFNLLLQTRDELSRVYDAVNQIQDVRSQLSGLKRRLPENASTKTIATAADDLEKKLVAVREELVNLTISANEDSLAYPPQLDAKLAYLGDGREHGGFGADGGRAAAIREAETAERGTDGPLGRLAAAGSGGVSEADGGGQLVDGSSASGGASDGRRDAGALSEGYSGLPMPAPPE